MRLTIIGKPEEISKFIKSISEGDDETEEVNETNEIGFLAEKKPDGNRTFNENFKDTKEIITYGSKRW